ncbi:MAG TPA: response regulator [Bryobacteraceae bacterium]|nr:response regulator [Bryobacteraceae bacterium]
MYRIILAEDNPGDVLLFREALRFSNLACELIVAEDGEKALALLETTGMPGSTSRPDLIVLDVNLPKRSGQDVLGWVRRHPILASIPVIVVTSAASPDDKSKATLLGANLCIQKSSNLDEVFKIGATVQSFLRDKTAEP